MIKKTVDAIARNKSDKNHQVRHTGFFIRMLKDAVFDDKPSSFMEFISKTYLPSLGEKTTSVSVVQSDHSSSQFFNLV